ncbi:protein doublesex-like [Copidosoma floridanum]|uniref:protein doublesex-like n=1 Tax=Copidosoma floridanum TaxID=29053 RepID=UPI0006C9CA53|nr:protein doublesex-like [Copidosoma floridanum]
MAEWAQRGRPAVPSDNNSNDGYNNPAVFYDELDSSDNESIGDGKQKSKKRVPKCARCKNHGIPAKVKDHKDVCPQRFCLCNKCIATSVRQREMKKQTAIRRKLVRYKKLTEKQKKISELKKLPMPRLNVSDEVIPAELPPSNNPSHMANNKSSTSNAVVEQPLANPPVAQNSSPMVLNLSAPEPEDTLKTNMNECNLTETEQTEILLGFSSRLMKRFGYSSEALSLIYVILKDTKKDVELAMKRIIEANNEIQETTLYKILKAGISYYYTNGPPVGHAVDNLGKPTYFGRVPYFGAGDSDLFHNPELSAKPLDSSDSPPKRPSSDPGVISPAAPASLGFFPYALGTPVMSAKVPTSPANPLQKSSSYPGMASPPTTAGLGIFPYSLGTYVTAAKVPARPSSPRERPSSYPGMASPPATTAGLGIFPYPLASYAATAKAPQPPTSPSSPRERPVPPYLANKVPYSNPLPLLSVADRLVTTTPRK